LTTQRTEDSVVGKILRRNIDKLLADKGWRPADLYDRLGVSAGSYSGYFKSQDGPTFPTLQRIATVLGCEPADLLQ
jgi:DNA-binding Xre family transcriptional regulator